MKSRVPAFILAVIAVFAGSPFVTSPPVEASRRQELLAQESLVLTAAIRSAAVTVPVNAKPNKQYFIIFFLSDTCIAGDLEEELGEFAGGGRVTTDGNGHAEGSFIVPIDAASQKRILQVFLVDFDNLQNPDQDIFLSKECIPVASILQKPSTIINGELRGLPNTLYTVNFFFTPAAATVEAASAGEPLADGCSGQNQQMIGTLPVLTGNDGTAQISVNDSTPSSNGFVNGTATSPTGSTIQSNCLGVSSPACPPTLFPLNRSVGAATSRESFTVAADQSCVWNVRSNADWITVTSSPTNAGVGAVEFVVAENAAASGRSGTIEVAGQTFTINQAGNGPQILGATRSGKKLFVTGARFDDGAVILLNGEKQKSANDEANPTTRLIAKKAGKKVRSGDRLQVKNSDGTLSNEFIYP